MASWTDIIPQFNPYVQQLPVEAMVQVGMEKQKRYEEGLTKIQSYIDSIAGLDVIRDVDKQYINSKMNELGNNLKIVAGGDFSNFQLVNSVSGMTNQIIKDPNVQAALQSTAWYRKQAGEIEKMKGTDKWSIQNQTDFNDNASRYIMSTDLGRKFTDSYTPYTETRKKAMEAIKALHPKLQSVDIPYVINPDGTIDTERIADVMVREKIEGIDEDQIKQAIYATMDPNDLNQLKIDARYQFRGVTPEALVNRAQLQYRQQTEDALSTIKYLNEKRQIASDPNTVSKIDKQLAYYKSLIGDDKQKGKLQEALEDNIKNAKDNPDEVKYSIYKDGFVQEFANAFSWKNQEKQILTSPLKAQQNFVWEQTEKIREFNINKALEKRRIDISEEELNLRKMEIALKKAELYGDPATSDWVPLIDPTTAEDQSEQMFAKMVTSIDDKIKGGEQQLLDQGYTQEQINSMLNDYKTNGNKSTLVKSKNIGLLQDILKNQNILTQLQNKEAQLKKEANDEVVNSSDYKQSLVDAENFINSINDGKPVTLYGPWDPTTKSNPTYTTTPKEIINNIASGKAKFYMDAGQIIYDDGNIRVDMPRHSGFFGSDVVGGGPMRNVFEKVLEYNKKGYFDIQQNATKKIDEVYNKKLAPIALTYVPQIKAVTSGKDGSPPPIVISRLSALATSADFNSIAADKNTDLETTSKFLSDKYNKDTRVFIKQDGDSYSVMIKNEQDPDKVQTLRLNRGQADVIRLFGEGYTNPRTTESILTKVGKGTPNLSGNAENAPIQKQFGDLPKIRHLQVTVDLEADGSNPDLYIPTINVKTKDGTYIPFEISGYDRMSRLGYDEVKKQVNSLDDDALLKLLKAQYPNYDFSNLDY